MAHLLVRQRVEDYAVWKSAFDDDAELRRLAGSLGGHVFQSADNPNEVFVLMAWYAMENLQQFAQSDELKARMQQAGVTGPQEIHFLNLADNPSV